MYDYRAQAKAAGYSAALSRAQTKEGTRSLDLTIPTHQRIPEPPPILTGENNQWLEYKARTKGVVFQYALVRNGEVVSLHGYPGSLVVYHASDGYFPVKETIDMGEGLLNLLVDLGKTRKHDEWIAKDNRGEGPFRWCSCLNDELDVDGRPGVACHMNRFKECLKCKEPFTLPGNEP